MNLFTKQKQTQTQKTTRLLYNTGNYIQHLVIAYNGTESEKEYTHTHTHTCIYILNHFVENNTVL